jgi:hypothetical protein
LILPFVSSSAHLLIVSGADGSPKSSGRTSASKYVRAASRNGSFTGRPCLGQTEFAMLNSTPGSRARSCSISPRYASLTLVSSSPPKPRTDRIASSVSSSAPFAVMPSAIETLSGETIALTSLLAALTRAKRSRPNATLELETPCSSAVNARGGIGSDGEPEQPASASPVVTATAGMIPSILMRILLLLVRPAGRGIPLPSIVRCADFAMGKARCRPAAPVSYT